MDMSGKKNNDSSSFYLLHKQEISEAFLMVVNGIKQFCEPELGAERVRKIAQEAIDHFDKLIPNLPNVGGERNRLVNIMPVAAYYVALYKPMKANGKTAEDVGKLLYDLLEMNLKIIPKEKSLEEGEKLFSQKALDDRRKWAEWTQKREFSANWVAEFIPGDGKEYDFGIDYSECALIKYLKQQDVPELSPYICLGDFPESAAKGTGLQRTHAIGYGDNLCNFRYKKGRLVHQDWSTEIVRIRSRNLG